MIIRALDGGAAGPWVAGDEVYGADPRLRGELERHRLPWSAWWRRRQHRARTSHYQKRAQT